VVLRHPLCHEFKTVKWLSVSEDMNAVDVRSCYIHFLLEQSWREVSLGFNTTLPTSTLPAQAVMSTGDAWQGVSSARAGSVTVLLLHFRRRVFGHTWQLVPTLLPLVDRTRVVHITRCFIDASSLLRRHGRVQWHLRWGDR
jgi:hypothetical protein